MVPHAPTHQRARRLRAALRSLRPSSVVAVTLALLFGGTTIADAAHGGNFLLGKANSETATATLTNTQGTPLKLAASVGHAPLAVTQATLVNNLNAQFTGGLSAAQPQTTGSEATRLPNSDIPIDGNPKVIVSTNPLPAGIYFITATALLNVAAGDIGGFCIIRKASDSATAFSEGGATQTGIVQAAETVATNVSAGDNFEEDCFDTGGIPSTVVGAGITAIRILANGSSDHGAPAGTPISAILAGPARPPAPPRQAGR